MERKRLALLAGAAAILVVLICAVIISGVGGFLRGRQQSVKAPGEVTRCDEGAAGLCVVSFGVDTFNHMVINFRLPEEDYPAFYVMVVNDEGSSNFACQRNEGTPASVSCSGPRSPVGGTIQLIVLTVGGDTLLAEGSMRIYAIALPSPVNLTLAVEGLTPEAIETATLFSVPQPADTGTPTAAPPASMTLSPTVTGTITPPTPTTTPATATTTPATATNTTLTGTTTPPTSTRTPIPSATATRFDSRK